MTILPVPNSAMVSDRWRCMHCTWLGVEGALGRLRRVQPRRRPARGQEQRRPQPPHNNRSLWQGHLATLTITSTPTSGNPGTDVKFSRIKFTFKIHIFFSSSLLESTRIEFLACADVYPAASLGKLDFGRTTSLQLGSSIAMECYNDTRLRARYSLFPC